MSLASQNNNVKVRGDKKGVPNGTPCFLHWVVITYGYPTL